MRINVTTLKEIVNANRQTVQQQAQKCQSQIETLNRISTDSGICDSKAYRSMFDYLRRVKVPALMQQVVFLEAYVTDMQTDLDRLSELETDGSGILDTGELTHQLNNLRLINDDIARWIERNREQNPTACFHVTQVMQGNQDFMAHLQQQIDLALTYDPIRRSMLRQHWRWRYSTELQRLWKQCTTTPQSPRMTCQKQISHGQLPILSARIQPLCRNWVRAGYPKIS